MPYDSNARCSQLEPGDWVLIHHKTYKGKHKIEDHWKSKPYVTIECRKDELPAYKVQHSETGKIRVLHLNLLFPLLSMFKGENMGNLDEDLLIPDGDQYQVKGTKKVP